jgi:hypothetical protein
MNAPTQSAILAASLLGLVAKAAESMGRPDIVEECRRDLEKLPVRPAKDRLVVLPTDIKRD